MIAAEERILAQTESVCPECLARIPAERVQRGDDVLLRKSCPQHGAFETIVWRGDPAYTAWARPKIPAYPRAPLTAVEQGCPFDCGLCPDHRQQTCTALLEVTQRCNLKCPVCFADAGGPAPADPDLDTIAGWFRRLLDSGGPCNVQLSGGEPTVRDDLPEIATLGRSMGFGFIQVNTNGLRLAADPGYAARLKAAGVASVFLQFDGTDDAIYRTLRGAALMAAKRKAIEHCAQNEIGVVLVPTLVPGVNMDRVGAIIDFALAHVPAVRGVHFQPVSYFGRYPAPPEDAQRVTIPDVICAVETQTGGRVRREAFEPPGCENALCSFHGNFVVMPDGSLLPWTQHTPKACCGAPEDAAEGAARTRGFVARQWVAPDAVIPLRAGP
ncbi:MAG TPA: radical SAM protein, partial [Aggregatilinea sp.]